MHSHQVDRIRIPHFLDVATYVSMAAMSLLGISGLHSLQSQLLALGLVSSFGLLYHFLFRSAGCHRVFVLNGSQRQGCHKRGETFRVRVEIYGQNKPDKATSQPRILQRHYLSSAA